MWLSRCTSTRRPRCARRRSARLLASVPLGMNTAISLPSIAAIRSSSFATTPSRENSSATIPPSSASRASNRAYSMGERATPSERKCTKRSSAPHSWYSHILCSLLWGELLPSPPEFGGIRRVRDGRNRRDLGRSARAGLHPRVPSADIGEIGVDRLAAADVDLGLRQLDPLFRHEHPHDLRIGANRVVKSHLVPSRIYG